MLEWAWSMSSYGIMPTRVLQLISLLCELAPTYLLKPLTFKYKKGITWTCCFRTTCSGKLCQNLARIIFDVDGDDPADPDFDVQAEPVPQLLVTGPSKKVKFDNIPKLQNYITVSDFCV